MKKSEIKKLATEENKKEYKETEEKFVFCIHLLDISAWDDNADELVDMLETELEA